MQYTLVVQFCIGSVPKGDKRSEVAIVFVQGNTIISVPAIENTFLFATGNGAYLVKRTLGVVDLSGSVEVKCLEVNRASGFAVFLRTHHHAMAPSHWLADWDGFQDA